MVSGNTVYTSGAIVVDGAQPDSPAISYNSSYIGPIVIKFENPVSSASIDVGYFDDLQSTCINFCDSTGAIIKSSYNDQYGIETFSCTNSSGIASIYAINTSYDASGFSLDNVTFGDPADTGEPPTVSLVSSSETTDRDLGTVGAGTSTMTLTDTLGPSDSKDYFTFEADTCGTATITSCLEQNPNETKEFTIDIHEGVNTILVSPYGQCTTNTQYSLMLNFNTLHTNVEEASTRWMKETGYDILGETFDLHEKMFEYISDLEYLKSAPEAKAFLSKWANGLGNIGTFIDFVKVADKVMASDNWKKTLFIEGGSEFIGYAMSGLGCAGLGPIGAIGCGSIINYFYNKKMEPIIKQYLSTIYDEHLKNNNFSLQELDSMEQRIAKDIDAIDLTPYTLDVDYYLSTYPDAKAAVLSGEVSSAYMHYLYIGSTLGYKPNANADPIPPDQLLLRQADGDPSQGYTTSVFTVTAGSLVGDHLSQAESAFLAKLNAMRTSGQELAADGALTALANRVARDWVLNNQQSPASAYTATNLSEWADTLSNGKSLAEAFADLDGLPSGLDLSSVKILGSSTRNVELTEAFARQ